MHFYEDDTSGRLYDANGEEIKVRYKNWLHKTASLSKNSRFICQECLNIAIKKKSGGEVLIQENSVESGQTESENMTKFNHGKRFKFSLGGYRSHKKLLWNKSER